MWTRRINYWYLYPKSPYVFQKPIQAVKPIQNPCYIGEQVGVSKVWIKVYFVFKLILFIKPLSTRHRIYQFSTCISNFCCIHFLRIWNLVIFHFFIISKERLVCILKKYLLVIFFQGLVHWEIWRYTHCIGCRKKKKPVKD